MENQDKTKWTMAVPEAGKKYLGLGRNASYRVARPYEEAQPGQIPTVWAGGKLRAVVKKLERLLAGDEGK